MEKSLEARALPITEAQEEIVDKQKNNFQRRQSIMEKSKTKKCAKPIPITRKDGMSKMKFLLLVKEAFDEASIDIGLHDAEVVVNCFVKALTEALHLGKMTFYRFGSFEPLLRPVRNGRNPHTSECIRVPEKVFIKFRTSPTLRDSLNQLSAKK